MAVIGRKKFWYWYCCWWRWMLLFMSGFRQVVVVVVVTAVGGDVATGDGLKSAHWERRTVEGTRKWSKCICQNTYTGRIGVMHGVADGLISAHWERRTLLFLVYLWILKQVLLSSF
jgi:hypothetical protein